MKILIIGQPENFDEFKLKFGNDHEYTFSESLEAVEDRLSDQELIFDFTIDEAPELIEVYNELSIPVFINTVKITLAELNFIYGLRQEGIFGFNGIKTFVNRPQLEVTTLSENAKPLENAISLLSCEFLRVNDRVGMVTPRVIFMIINEAFYTVQEGTAEKEDIDQGMKLGTNYPYGPFEWSEKIGISDVYETLEAMYEDTKDERYKICPLLKQAYLKLS